MQNELQVFVNEEFGEIRTIEIEGQPWFVGNDVTQALGYEKSRNALTKHVDEDDALKWGVIDSLGRKQNTTIINESGLYSLILSSKLPNAKAFKRWVTSEVLPSIRKTGAYIRDDLLEKLAQSEKTAAQYLKMLNAEKRINKQSMRVIKQSDRVIKAMDEFIDEAKPIIEYCESVLQCENTIPVSVIAKDYGMSAAGFNRILCSAKIQYRVGGVWVLYSKYDGNGYTATNTFIKEGKAIVHTVWTQKGREFLYEKLKEFDILPEYETEQQSLFDNE